MTVTVGAEVVALVDNETGVQRPVPMKETPAARSERRAMMITAKAMATSSRGGSEKAGGKGAAERQRGNCF